MNSDEIIKRLAFIKYLQSVGQEQSEKPEPMCWASILTFHDVVELYLQLVAEYVQVKKRLSDVHFMEYWELINPELKKLNKPELSQKISMERLNKARVDFKHYGNAPSKTAITNDFGLNTKNFLEESTAKIFGFNFSEVSLVELVNCENVKKDLIKAEELLKTNNLNEALNTVAIAFVKLIDDYEGRKTDKWGYSPFSLGTAISNFDFDLGESGRSIKESIDALKEAIKIIGFGIDFKRYGMFKYLTPHVYQYVGGRYEVSSINEDASKTMTADKIRFCIDFVIESALTLQEFDYGLTRSPASRPNYHKFEDMFK